MYMDLDKNEQGVGILTWETNGSSVLMDVTFIDNLFWPPILGFPFQHV